MPAVTIRNLSEETHRALKQRAALRRHSTEAEIRAVLDEAVRPRGRLLLGTALAGLAVAAGLTNADVEALSDAADAAPALPLTL